MEAAATAKDAALAASAAAAAAHEATAAAEESAAALNAKEAAATALAVALNAKEAAATAGEAAAATAGEAAAAAMQASKKRKFCLISDDNNNGDLISRLPDDLLRAIISLLPAKDGARTQAISCRWRPLWRSAPLNLVPDRDLATTGRRAVGLIQKILSEHSGPARCFSLSLLTNGYFNNVQGWLSSQALNNLQELDLSYGFWLPLRDRNRVCRLPSSAFRFAPTLRMARLCGCHFPDLTMPKFPCLKQLTLERVTILEDALHNMLSLCTALESLKLKNNLGIVRLCISSQTLKSFGFCTDWTVKGVVLQELLIEDVPCLERFLLLDPKHGPAAIRVISAPKLKILGMLSEDIEQLQFGTTFFQMIAVSVTAKMHTVRILVLDSAGPNLGTVVNLLKCFPCLERLYVIFQSGMAMDNVRKYDPVDPVECFELHLSEVVLKNYDGTKTPCIEFAKFFVLNAKVLKEMKISLPYHRQHKWFAHQRELLRIKDRASQDARIELACGSKEYLTHNRHTHDLSIADPFDIPSWECFRCSSVLRG